MGHTRTPTILFYVLVYLELVQVALGLYGPKSNVIALNKKNFADNVIASEHVWVVEFFAPVCSPFSFINCITNCTLLIILI